MKYFRISFIVITALIYTSCGPAVKFIPSGSNKEPKTNNYQVLVLAPDNKLSNDCEIIGEISVHDSGISINCGFDVVLSNAIEQAKKVGADAIKIIEVKKPDMISTCYRIKALAISYKGPKSDSLTLDKLLAPLDSSNSAFISFSDCYICNDYGDVNSLSKQKTKINLVPFFAFTVYADGTNEVVHYPITESRITPHFLNLLEGYDWNANLIVKDSDDYKKYFKYYTDLFNDFIRGKGNPLTWGQNASIELNDTSSVIYIPFAIEREAQHNVRARFYTLIANSKGKIIFSRCFDFEPQIWSRDFNSFANDIEGRLPLAND